MLPPTNEVDDDVFQDSGPIIVDCDVLEAAKENVQPLGTGRRVTALSAILATPHAQREAKLSATRNRLRINVEIALDDELDGDVDVDVNAKSDGTEALEAYWQFVNWTLDNYPQGHSAESGLLELLEEATRVLKDHRGGVCKKDVKYLKLWLLYASYVEKPVVIYKFLIVNEIGTGFALLYEEYAAVLERDGRRKEADDAYSLGIARRATPLDRLQERYNDFQKRMMSNMMLPPAPPASTSHKPRQALATTSLKPPTAPPSSSRQPTPRSVSNPVPMASSSTNSRLQIFADPTGTESQAAATAVESSTGGVWQDLGTRKTRIKENVPEVGKLAGTTLKQAGKTKRAASASVVSSGVGSRSSGSSSSSSSSMKIAVFRDPGPVDMPPPPLPVPAAKTKVPTRPTPIPPKTPARGTSFAPFVDSNPDSGQPHSLPPVTPKFTPFRDETSISGGNASPTRSSGIDSSNPLTESAIKVKKSAGLNGIGGGSNVTSGGGLGLGPSSEAEALRKDPLKNYPGVGIADDA